MLLGSKLKTWRQLGLKSHLIIYFITKDQNKPFCFPGLLFKFNICCHCGPSKKWCFELTTTSLSCIFYTKAKNGDGSCHSIREVLEYLLEIKDVKEAIKSRGKTVRLRFAADDRRTSKRIGTVMAVFIVLAEDRHSFEYQCTLALYNGKDSLTSSLKCHEMYIHHQLY